MENMAKGCGRSDAIEGVERMPRIVIPSVESKVDSLTSTTYSSTIYSATYTFDLGVSCSSLSSQVVSDCYSFIPLRQAWSICINHSPIVDLLFPQANYCTTAGYTGALSALAVCGAWSAWKTFKNRNEESQHNKSILSNSWVPWPKLEPLLDPAISDTSKTFLGWEIMNQLSRLLLKVEKVKQFVYIALSW